MFPLDPRGDEIHIEDIAHALSMLCRFNGHVKRFYSVAEHCCHVSDLLPDSWKLTGLLHDASEAYLCDVPRPLKRSPGFADGYLLAERKLEQAICQKFGARWPYPQAVHAADNRLLATEALQLMAPLHPEWRDLYFPVEGLSLPCWAPPLAQAEFLARFEALTGSTPNPQQTP
jgi:uncharacterized protein